ncbi:reverse transcriptase domain-containing protein [Tanacetum coccineum]
MPSKRNQTTTLMSDVAIKALVARSVADALAKHEANKSKNRDDNHDSGSGRRRQVPSAREMESVFHISNCKVGNQVKYATYTLLGNALTWWNFHVKTVGHDAAYGMPWKTLMKMMSNKYCPREKYVGGLPDMIQGSVMAFKPKTMQEAIEIANALIHQKCAPKCNCKKVVHPARDCRSPSTNVNNQRAPRAIQKAGNGGAQARAYAVGSAGKNPNANVLTGTFLLNNHYASILFDTGADRSFVSTAFSSLIDIIPTALDHDYDVELADEK